MKNKQITGDRVTVADASILLEMSTISVQGALKCKAIPIGGAWKNEGSDCYTYHISLHLLGKYLGMSKEEMFEKIKNNGGSKDVKDDFEQRVG